MNDVEAARENYSLFPVLFHWSSAIMIFIIIITGFILRVVSRYWQRNLMIYHIAASATLLIITLPRLIWPLIEPHPSVPKKLKDWQKVMYSKIHILLYLLVFLNLLTGAIFLFSTPLLTFLNSDSETTIKDTISGYFFTNWHRLLAYILIILIVLHSVGVFWYQKSKGDVLSRMSFKSA